MQWNDHSNLEGLHATFGASQYYWINYSVDKMLQVFKNNKVKQLGSELHEHAANCIKYHTKLRGKQTLALYVNDAIGYRMQPEQVLYYSPYFFGTADAIYFSEKTKVLRIHDLKTGVTKPSFHQLEIYAALFCLEYNYKPGDLDIYLRLYQNDDYMEGHPSAEDIVPIIDKIVTFNKVLMEEGADI